ncbi:hypothetical protein BU23DRAFT_155021 [Bimuria novae-zelandiae CBS 107.79]|uniref:Uncharacterized protein n=1 Tax=Bimuria novae-zelandiae CBS 107.79 TaxID=1447943 RepID=A0A6A5V9A7_9PLEO|nr:hypothetical protein BU23DRAFT_155021 [Bimuria novae-zelandiae CBS 107.79]
MFRYGEKRMLDSLTALMENLKISRVPTTGHISIASLTRVLYLDGEGIVVRAFGAPLASDNPHFPGAISLDVHARISLVGRHLKSAKLFFTSTGDVGVGPSNAQDGDILCLFLGAWSPTILRRVDETSQYQVVGTCWTEQVLDDGTYFGLLADGWDQSPDESVRLDANMPQTGEQLDNESTGAQGCIETFTYDPERKTTTRMAQKRS